MLSCTPVADGKDREVKASFNCQTWEEFTLDKQAIDIVADLTPLQGQNPSWVILSSCSPRVEVSLGDTLKPKFLSEGEPLVCEWD